MEHQVKKVNPVPKDLMEPQDLLEHPEFKVFQEIRVSKVKKVTVELKVLTVLLVQQDYLVSRVEMVEMACLVLKEILEHQVLEETRMNQEQLVHVVPLDQLVLLELQD